ncbi:MAG: 4Fe-4S binding protein [Mariniphaga sp.]|nr:4Fe-4S binding protein [Mariniphaga sp.]
MLKCPVKAITKVNKRPFWTYRCESCMRCVNICPQRAIETAHSYVGILILISSFVISPFLISLLKSWGMLDFFDQSVITKNLWTVIYTIIFLVFVFISYGFLHFFMRFKVVNRIFAYTSLSKYKFWRRYKAPKVRINS